MLRPVLLLLQSGRMGSNPLAGIEVVGMQIPNRRIQRPEPSAVIPWRGLRSLGFTPTSDANPARTGYAVIPWRGLRSLGSHPIAANIQKGY